MIVVAVATGLLAAVSCTEQPRIGDAGEPTYRAEALVLVHLPRVGEGRFVPPDYMDQYLAMQAEIATSETVFRKAAEREEVQSAFYFKDVPKEDRLSVLRDVISVSVVPKTHFLRVEMTAAAGNAKERAGLADVVNAVAQEAIRYIQNIANADRDSNIQEFSAQRRTLDQELTSLQRELKESTETLEHRLLLVNEFRNRATLLIDLEQKKEEAKAEWTRIKDLSDEDLLQDPRIRMAIDGDPALAALRRQESQVDLRLKALEERFGKEHSSVQAAKADLENIQREVSTKVSGLAADAASGFRAATKNEYDTVLAKLLQAGERTEEIKAKLRELEVKLEERQPRVDRAAAIKSNINLIDKRLLELRILSREKRVSLAKPAEIPRTPVR